MITNMIMNVNTTLSQIIIVQFEYGIANYSDIKYLQLYDLLE